MKKQLLTLLVPILIIFCFISSKAKSTYITASSSPNNEKVFEFVKNEITAFLEYIPIGFEKEHGFTSRDEFSKAIPGSVYLIKGIGIDGNIFATNLYNIPIVVDGEYRAMLTISYSDNTYQFEAIGANLLAKEIQILEKEMVPDASFEKIILNIYSKQCGFVTYKEGNTRIEDATFIPLASAKTALEETNRATGTTYKLNEIVTALLN